MKCDKCLSFFFLFFVSVWGGVYIATDFDQTAVMLWKRKKPLFCETPIDKLCDSGFQSEYELFDVAFSFFFGDISLCVCLVMKKKHYANKETNLFYLRVWNKKK